MNLLEALNHFWPYGDRHIPGLRAGIATSAPAVIAKYDLNPLVLLHVLAQVSHECGAGVDVVENLNYSAARLQQVWPRHFNATNSMFFAHNPETLANFVYEPPIHRDLGNNTHGDGWKYRGRGASQTTGRAGYEKLGKAVGLDLVLDPDLVNDPARFFECGVADFIICGCKPYAERDDIVGVTRHLNGGLIGLASRRFWLARWKGANLTVA